MVPPPEAREALSVQSPLKALFSNCILPQARPLNLHGRNQSNLKKEVLKCLTIDFASHRAGRELRNRPKRSMRDRWSSVQSDFLPAGLGQGSRSQA